MAEVWDQSSIVRMVNLFIASGVNLHASFLLGKQLKRADQFLLDDSKVVLMDQNNSTVFLLGKPIRAMAARFSGHPLHNFIRLYYEGLSESRQEQRDAFFEKMGSDYSKTKIRFIEKAGWLLIYPMGSLLYDQRLGSRVKDLLSKGKDASLFVEFMAVDEEESGKSKKIELADYCPEDEKLWVQWLDKMDTNIFQTIVKPKNFRPSSGYSEDYYLKMIVYGNKKVGAIWLENINQRNGTAEMGLLIGEPHLWGMGLGSRAMSAMIEIAKEDLGLKFLWVSVREANQRAVNSYLKGGFSIVRKAPVFNKADGSYQIWLHMEKMI